MFSLILRVLCSWYFSYHTLIPFSHLSFLTFTVFPVSLATVELPHFLVSQMTLLLRLITICPLPPRLLFTIKHLLIYSAPSLSFSECLVLFASLAATPSVHYFPNPSLTLAPLVPPSPPQQTLPLPLRHW